jgi:hypothetical protein
VYGRELLFIIWALVHQDEGRAEGGKKEDLDNLPAILAILRSIKNAEDLVDNSKTDVCCISYELNHCFSI